MFDTEFSIRLECGIHQMVRHQTSSGDWKEAETEGSYPIVKDEINTVRFKKVTASAVKIEIQLPEDNSAGIYEWIVE